VRADGSADVRRRGNQQGIIEVVVGRNGRRLSREQEVTDRRPPAARQDVVGLAGSDRHGQLGRESAEGVVVTGDFGQAAARPGIHADHAVVGQFAGRGQNRAEGAERHKPISRRRVGEPHRMLERVAAISAGRRWIVVIGGEIVEIDQRARRHDGRTVVGQAGDREGQVEVIAGHQ